MENQTIKLSEIHSNFASTSLEKHGGIGAAVRSSLPTKPINKYKFVKGYSLWTGKQYFELPANFVAIGKTVGKNIFFTVGGQQMSMSSNATVLKNNNLIAVVDDSVPTSESLRRMYKVISLPKGNNVIKIGEIIYGYPNLDSKYPNNIRFFKSLPSNTNVIVPFSIKDSYLQDISDSFADGNSNFIPEDQVQLSADGFSNVQGDKGKYKFTRSIGLNAFNVPSGFVTTGVEGANGVFTVDINSTKQTVDTSFFQGILQKVDDSTALSDQSIFKNAGKKSNIKHIAGSAGFLAGLYAAYHFKKSWGYYVGFGILGWVVGRTGGGIVSDITNK